MSVPVPKRYGWSPLGYAGIMGFALFVFHLITNGQYGFHGDELYFNSDNLVNTTLKQLSEGDAVKFIEDMAAEGPQAKRVSVGHHHLPE